jgi:hypothetical protein
VNGSAEFACASEFPNSRNPSAIIRIAIAFADCRSHATIPPTRNVHPAMIPVTASPVV